MEKYFITEKHTGLGSDVASVVGSWYYAKLTGRALVIDWRSSLYLDAPGVNAFNVFFEPIEELFGVRVISDQATNRFLSLGSSVIVEDKYDSVWVQLQRGESLDQQVIINRAPSRLFPPLVWQYNILKCLIPTINIRQQYHRFQERYVSSLPRVGLHYRHGNGEDIDRCGDDVESFTDKYVRAIDALGIKNCAVFLVCTDSIDVMDIFRKKLNNVIQFEKQFKKPGAGPLHLSGDATAQTGYDAITEMLLLATCNVLLHNLGWFSYFSRVMLEQNKRPIITID